MSVSRRVMVGLVPATALLSLAGGDGGAQDPLELGATAGDLTRASTGRTRLEAAGSAPVAAGGAVLLDGARLDLNGLSRPVLPADSGIAVTCPPDGGACTVAISRPSAWVLVW